MTDSTGGRNGPGRGARLVLLAGLSFVLVLAGREPFAGGSAVVAQERSVMDMLFGSRPTREPRYFDDDDDGYNYDDEEPPPIRREKPKPPRREKPARSGKPQVNTGASRAAAAGTRAPAAPARVAVEKSPTAKTVLVVGDFLAGSLAGGLAETLADNPAIRVENAVDGSSGLVRDDHFDWISKIGPMIDEKKPAVVVVMLGSNDRQAMRVGDASFGARSAEWEAEYGRRADALAEAVRARSVPLVWVGMPSFRFERMSKDMAFLNEVYRKASGTVGGDFVDVWDGFVDANGAFSSSGPDIAGQQARLRNADGITMTPKGAEKIAFFAQKPIFRLLGASAVPDLADPAPGTAPSAAAAAARPANATSAPLVSFNDPALDGGDVLLGEAAGVLASAAPSPRDRLVVSGDPVATPEGRADSFNWSGKTQAVSPLRGTDDVISRGSVELRMLRASGGIKPPQDMPSLADAIIADWEAQNAAEAATRAGPGGGPPPGPPAAGAATAAPNSASPFAAAGRTPP